MRQERPNIPEWARRERLNDLAWIGENMEIFMEAAMAGFSEADRGAIVVDVTRQPTGAGNPFAYFPQEAIEVYEDEDISRIVRTYDPEKEMVVVLLKSGNRTSTYRVGQIKRVS